MDRRTLLRLAAVGLVAPGLARAGPPLLLHSGARSGGATSSVAWDFTTAGTGITQTSGGSGANDATHTAAASQSSIHANTPLGSGKYYWEVIWLAMTGNAFSSVMSGVMTLGSSAQNAARLGNIGGNNSAGISAFQSQILSDITTSATNNGAQPGPANTWVVAGVTGQAFDGATGKFWASGDGSNYWGGLSAGSPAAGTFGEDVTGRSASLLYPAVTLWQNGDRAQFNQGATFYTPPSGFARL